MIENPNFTAMKKSDIVAWAKEHLQIDIEASLLKDAMIAEVENEIARRAAFAPELPPGGTVEPAPEENQPPVVEAAAEPASEPAPVSTGRPFRLMIRSAPYTGSLPIRVNGRKHDLPIGEWIEGFDKSLLPLLDAAPGVDYITSE